MIAAITTRPLSLLRKMRYNHFLSFATTAAALQPECLSPEIKQRYKILNNAQISSDSHILTVGFQGRDYLGWDSRTPTCISVSYYNDNIMNDSENVLAKSYSPISHPSQPDAFQLLVKKYPPRIGGGVGAYICSLQPEDYFEAEVKSPRIMHGSPEVLGRWKNVGLIAGGTGIAPLYQLLLILLKDDTCKVSILSINQFEKDVLLKSELDQLVQDYPERISVTYSLTGETKNGCQEGRGSVAMVHQGLPDSKLEDVMIFVCGKDGFVEHWGGKVGRAKMADGSKGPKIQGPLFGILQEAGYDASQVFKY
jgi:cytochrome-b5 reductase